MKKMTWVFALPLVLLGSASVSASPITVDDPKWYGFTFGATGSFATGGGNVTNSANSQNGPAAPWTFTLGSLGGVLKITDVEFYGDRFTVLDNGNPIGTTPFVTPVSGSVTGDPAVAYADPLFSHASFFLGAGNHSITIQAFSSPFGSGDGFFRVDSTPTPEPATLIAFGVMALGGAGYVRRRKVAAAA